MNVNNQDNSNSGEKLLERIPLQNTPFHIVGNRTQGRAICFGKYRISELFAFGIVDEETIIHEAEEHLEINQWNLISRLSGIISEIVMEIKPNGGQNISDKFKKANE